MNSLFATSAVEEISHSRRHVLFSVGSMRKFLAVMWGMYTLDLRLGCTTSQQPYNCIQYNTGKQPMDFTRSSQSGPLKQKLGSGFQQVHCCIFEVDFFSFFRFLLMLEDCIGGVMIDCSSDVYFCLHFVVEV